MKCLVTKLKATVNNDNLPVFNALVINFRQNGTDEFSNALYIDGVSLSDISCEGSLFYPLSAAGEEGTIHPQGTVFRVKNKNCKIKILNKHSLTILQLVYNEGSNNTAKPYFDVKELDFCTKIGSTNKKIKLSLDESECYGDLTNFLRNSNYNALVSPGISNVPDITYDAAFLGKDVQWLNNIHSSRNKLTYTSGIRADSSCRALSTYQVSFKDFDADKFLIDSAKCNLSAEGRTEIDSSYRTRISIDSSNTTYTDPNAVEVRTAIKTILEAGWTIRLNRKELTLEDVS